MEHLKRLLTKGIEWINERRKLIKITDRSEQGWKTTEEYKKDPVAANSDDEKRIQKAEVAAKRKAAEKTPMPSFSTFHPMLY